MRKWGWRQGHKEMLSKAVAFYNKVNRGVGNIFPTPTKDEEDLKGLFYIMYWDCEFEDEKTKDKCEFYMEYFKKYRRRK